MQRDRARLRRRLQPLPARHRRRQPPRPALPRRAWVHPITEMDVYRRFYQLGAAREPGRRDRRHRAARSRRPPPVAAADRRPAAPQMLATGRRSELPLGGIGSNAVGARQATRPTTAHGHAARQPALPVGRARSASTRPSSRSRARSTSTGGSLFGVPAGPDRPHRQPRLEPHGLDRVPLHAVRADARPGLADAPTSTTASRSR